MRSFFHYYFVSHHNFLNTYIKIIELLEDKIKRRVYSLCAELFLHLLFFLCGIVYKNSRFIGSTKHSYVHREEYQHNKNVIRSLRFRENYETKPES